MIARRRKQDEKKPKQRNKAAHLKRVRSAHIEMLKMRRALTLGLGGTPSDKTVRNAVAWVARVRANQVFIDGVMQGKLTMTPTADGNYWFDTGPDVCVDYDASIGKLVSYPKSFAQVLAGPQFMLEENVAELSAEREKADRGDAYIAPRPTGATR